MLSIQQAIGITPAAPRKLVAAMASTEQNVYSLFKRLKHRLALEHLSGMSWLAEQQDFGAKILCDLR